MKTWRFWTINNKLGIFNNQTQVTLGMVISAGGLGLGGWAGPVCEVSGVMEHFGEKSLKWVAVHRKSILTVSFCMVSARKSRFWCPFVPETILLIDFWRFSKILKNRRKNHFFEIVKFSFWASQKFKIWTLGGGWKRLVCEIIAPHPRLLWYPE